MNLSPLDLPKNEEQIYLFLLKNGSTTTGAIIKETGIANSRVYESLHSLIAKGFVTYTVEKYGKHFAAADPRKFLEIAEERRKKIESLVPDLLKLRSLKRDETISAVYEGFEGFKTAFKKIIDDCPTGGNINILGFSEQQFATKSLRTFLANMNLKSAEKEQHLKIIMDESTRKTLGKDRAKEKYTEVRYMPKGYVSPAAIDMFEDCVFIFLWEEKPFVFMIKNRMIAKSFMQYFAFLWSISKKE
ncbi:MAG: helix-turn-helix domain-containing protein [Nanoarchaeota archaeon]